MKQNVLLIVLPTFKRLWEEGLKAPSIYKEIGSFSSPIDLYVGVCKHEYDEAQYLIGWMGRKDQSKSGTIQYEIHRALEKGIRRHIVSMDSKAIVYSWTSFRKTEALHFWATRISDKTRREGRLLREAQLKQKASRWSTITRICANCEDWEPFSRTSKPDWNAERGKCTNVELLENMLKNQLFPTWDCRACGYFFQFEVSPRKRGDVEVALEEYSKSISIYMLGKEEPNGQDKA